MRVIASLLLVVVCATLCAAQDPADGWMAYAVGKVPTGTQRITHIEMSWKVSANAKSSSAFYSPWFGMDPPDNLNLLQPVNPWGGSSWTAYTEYYQWSPSKNVNSKEITVKAGQTLHGVITYENTTDSYVITQTVVETGSSSTQTVKSQNAKKFNLPYVVYEKVWTCADYPPDGVVTFTNISIQCDYADCTNTVKWSAAVKDANCGMAAHVDKYPQQISITWNPKAESVYDNWEVSKLVEYNSQGWGRQYAELYQKQNPAAL